MAYRNRNYYFDKGKYSTGWGFHPQNTSTKPRYYQNDTNPRDYHPNENPRDYHSVKKHRDYHQNDKDFRPESYRKDRDDRPLLPEIVAKEKERNRSTTAFENEPRLNYVRNVRNLKSGKIEKKLLIDDEDFKKWNIGVEFNVTSDKPQKLHWQTKEQMDSYGMVGGHFYEEDCRTGEIKCSLYGQCVLPLQERSYRSRSMSRPGEPRSNSRPNCRKPTRSRSVCFSEKITRIEYECESESDMNDFSQENMEIDDTRRNDVLESESSDEQRSERKLIPENSKAGIASVKSNSKEPKYTEHSKMTESDELKSMRLKSNEENSGNRVKKKLVKDSVQDVINNKGGDKLVKDLVQDVSSNEGGGKLVKDSVQDVRSNEGGDNYPSNLGANICPPTLDNNPMLKLALKDKISHVKSNKKFHGFGKDFSNDLRQLELRTSIIKMQNQYEEDCQEFAQNTYDVIMESTLADINQTFYDSSQVDVHNAETILGGKLSDSFQNYLIPIEDIFEDDTVRMVTTDEPFLRSQEEEFDAETNVALSNVFTKLNNHNKSPEMSRPVDNDLLSLPQESSLSSYNPTQTNPTLEVKAQLDREQSKSRRSNPQQMVEDINMCQNVLQLNRVHSVSEDPTDNETSKPNEYALDSHVEHQEIESDIENNCLQNLNLNYLAKNPISLKMKIVKVEGNRFKVENIKCDATAHSQTANPLCVPTPAPAIASKSSSESKESSRFSVATASNASLQLRNCVLCKVCGAKSPRSFVDPGEMLEDISAWQCQDCAVCILCFRRHLGERLLVCCKCGHRYHKTCARVDQIAQHGTLFVCKNCTA